MSPEQAELITNIVIGAAIAIAIFWTVVFVVFYAIIKKVQNVVGRSERAFIQSKNPFDVLQPVDKLSREEIANIRKTFKNLK